MDVEVKSKTTVSLLGTVPLSHFAKQNWDRWDRPQWDTAGQKDRPQWDTEKKETHLLRCVPFRYVAVPSPITISASR